MRPCRATRAGTQAPPLPISTIFSHTNKIIIYGQSIQTTSTAYAQSPKRHQPSAHVICPNEAVGAVPMCPPEHPRSGVSIPKTHALCVGGERWMRPCRATRAGTQAPPLPNSIIFFHAIPHKQNSVHAQFTPNEINRPCAIRSYQSPSNHAV